MIPIWTPPPYSPAKRGAPLEERLAAFPFLDGLDPEARRKLVAATTPAHFDRATTLVGASHEIAAIPLVERGAIHVQRSDESGRSLALYDVVPGESCVLALAGALRGGRYPAEATVEADSDVLLVDAAAMREAFSQDASLQQFVLELYSARLVEMMQLVREVAFDRLDVRLARLLLTEASAGPGMWKPVEASHSDLAARLGSAREVISRALSRLRADGLVTLERSRIVVDDPRRLAERFGLALPA